MSSPRRRAPSRSRRSDRSYPFRLDSLPTRFIPFHESRVVIRCVRVDVVLLLHHHAPHPFEPPFPIDPRSPTLVLIMAPSIRCGLHVAGCLSFDFFLFDTVGCRYNLFCTANLLQNRDDTTAETLAGLSWRTRSGNVNPQRMSKGRLYLVDKDSSC